VVEGGVVSVAAELVEGLTLDELVARHGPLPVRRVAQLGLELLDALEAVHAAGLAHLDLRPANVLVAPASPIPAAFSPPWREAPTRPSTAPWSACGGPGTRSTRRWSGCC